MTLDGTPHMCAAVWPHMAKQGYGRIVNTTSNAGCAGSETLVGHGAAKLGVAGLTKCLAQEVAGTGIIVNAIAPKAVTRITPDQLNAVMRAFEDAGSRATYRVAHVRR